MNMPRAEYPRPQFVRPDWLCLNGEWEFEIDGGDSGLERGLKDHGLKGRITVPFCPESKLSGVENTDFLAAVWYRRAVKIPVAWKGRRVLLHFQAVDHDTTVWVNGKEVGRHRGGFTPFTCDLGGVVEGGESGVIVVRARDSHQGPQARGKQSQLFGNHGCMYVRTTGIWQTVWMEPVPESSLGRPRITPDVTHGCLRVQQPVRKGRPGMRVRITARDGTGEVAKGESVLGLDFQPQIELAIPEGRRRLWSTKDPHLYDLEIELIDKDGTVIDNAQSYAGLRSVALDGMAIRINGEVVFQRLVLDQGYYPDGILTAPTDDALRRDITMSQEAGFNGARLHQKVFEERFLYHADRLGYLVWGEFPDWGFSGISKENDRFQAPANYITQWLEALERDYSHPSIIGWCPLNETAQVIRDDISQLDDVMRGMFLAAKAMDLTRPVLDSSGYSHRVLETDIYDSHDYEQDPVKLAGNHKGLKDGQPLINGAGETSWSLAYRGQPYFVSEFGGIWWNPEVKPGDFSWGYGERPKSLEEFYSRFEGQCAALLDHPLMFGYCYTQLTDVFQEQNGIFLFDRRGKFDLERIRKAQQRKAAIEG